MNSEEEIVNAYGTLLEEIKVHVISIYQIFFAHLDKDWSDMAFELFIRVVNLFTSVTLQSYLSNYDLLLQFINLPSLFNSTFKYVIDPIAQVLTFLAPQFIINVFGSVLDDQDLIDGFDYIKDEFINPISSIGTSIVTIFYQIGYVSFLTALQGEHDNLLGLVTEFGSIFSEKFRNLVVDLTTTVSPHIQDYFEQMINLVFNFCQSILSFLATFSGTFSDQFLQLYYLAKVYLMI